MGIIITAILKNLLLSLLTEKTVGRVFVALGEELAKSTKNDLDDKIVIAAADALGVPTSLKNPVG